MNAPFSPIKRTETREERQERLAEEAWEALRAECEEEFTEWQRADYERREFEDFGNWLANKARWNGGGKYRDALTCAEARFIPDADGVRGLVGRYSG